MNPQLNLENQQLQTLFDIGKSVTAQLDLEAVLRQVVKAAVTLTGADESYLLLVDKPGGQLYLRAEANLGAEEVKNFRVKVSDSIAGQVVQTGQPIVINRDSSSLKVKTGLVVYALVNVPLKMGNQVIGVLGVDNRQQQRAFSTADQLVLSGLADWAAISIQNAQLYETTVEMRRNLELINEVSRLVTGTLDVEQIPRVLIRRVAEIFGAECGSLALINHERDGVVFQLAYDGEGNELVRLKDFLMPLGQGIVGKVAQTGEPIIVNDVNTYLDWSPLADRLTGFVTYKIMAVPLITEGEVLGVIELLNKQAGNFDQNDLQLLLLVAASTAIAIQNARRYAALQEAQEQRIASERWTVLGKAAGSLAHRINNTTTLVPIAVQHLRELLQQLTLTPELREAIDSDLERIERNTLYTVELATALLRRFRHTPAQAHDINQLIKRALAVIEIPPTIRLICHLAPDLPSVDTSELLVDAMLELLTNAQRVLEGQPDALVRVASFRVDNRVSIQITDNGPGISPEDMPRIFELFYTTHPTGLGFGLWWVKNFLEQQHGQIGVESLPGQGTTFTISLPCGPLRLP